MDYSWVVGGNESNRTPTTNGTKEYRVQQGIDNIFGDECWVRFFFFKLYHYPFRFHLMASKKKTTGGFGYKLGLYRDTTIYSDLTTI